jgi:hypothetical protein
MNKSIFHLASAKVEELHADGSTSAPCRSGWASSLVNLEDHDVACVWLATNIHILTDRCSVGRVSCPALASADGRQGARRYLVRMQQSNRGRDWSNGNLPEDELTLRRCGWWLNPRQCGVRLNLLQRAATHRMEKAVTAFPISRFV